MLKITVIAVGKLKEKFWAAACDEYLKRLRPYAKVAVAEIPDVDPARAGGVSDAVRARADETFSFGPITLPHNLARVVLLEQIYRAFKISRGEPYHK